MKGICDSIGPFHSRKTEHQNTLDHFVPNVSNIFLLDLCFLLSSVDAIFSRNILTILHSLLTPPQSPLARTPGIVKLWDVRMLAEAFQTLDTKCKNVQQVLHAWCFHKPEKICKNISFRISSKNNCPFFKISRCANPRFDSIFLPKHCHQMVLSLIFCIRFSQNPLSPWRTCNIHPHSGRLVPDAPRSAGRQRTQRERAAFDRRCRAAAPRPCATDARRLVVLVVNVVVVLVHVNRPLESVPLCRRIIIRRRPEIIGKAVRCLCNCLGKTVSTVCGKCLWR